MNLSLYVRIPEEMDKDTEPNAAVAHYTPDGEGAKVTKIQVEKQRRFKTRNVGRRTPRRWYFDLTLPPELAAGDYSITFPKAATIVVLESDAEDIRLYDD